MWIPIQEYCETHYVTPDDIFITCEHFGKCNKYSECQNCHTMTKYQYYMCSDEQLRQLLLKQGFAKEEVIHKISEIKRYSNLLKQGE